MVMCKVEGCHLTPNKRNTRYCISNKGVLLHRLLMDDPEGYRPY